MFSRLIASPRPLGDKGSDVFVRIQKLTIACFDDMGDFVVVGFAGYGLVPGDCAKGGFAPAWVVVCLWVPLLRRGGMWVDVGYVPRRNASS